jgi:hypothetical protein
MDLNHNSETESQVLSSDAPVTAEVLEPSWRYLRNLPPAISTNRDLMTLFQVEQLQSRQPRWGNQEQVPSKSALNLLNSEYYRHLTIYRQRTNYSNGMVEWNCAFSVCHPGDAFDRRRGQEIARNRFEGQERFTFLVRRIGEIYYLYFGGRHLTDGTRYRFQMSTAEEIRTESHKQAVEKFGGSVPPQVLENISNFTMTSSQILDTIFTIAYVGCTLAWRRAGPHQLISLRTEMRRSMGGHLEIVDQNDVIQPWLHIE